MTVTGKDLLWSKYLSLQKFGHQVEQLRCVQLCSNFVHENRLFVILLSYCVQYFIEHRVNFQLPFSVYIQHIVVVYSYRSKNEET